MCVCVCDFFLSFSHSTHSLTLSGSIPVALRGSALGYAALDMRVDKGSDVSCTSSLVVVVGEVISAVLSSQP